MSSLCFHSRNSSQGFKTSLLEKGFYTLLNGGLFSSPPPFGASVLAGTPSVLQSMWDHPKSTPPPVGASVLPGTPPCVYPPSRNSEAGTSSGVLTLIPFVTPHIPSNRCGIAPKSTPLCGPASLLAHLLVSTPLREQREG